MSDAHRNITLDHSDVSAIPDVNNKENNFSFLHWNVGGLLPKLKDYNFVQYVSSFDFVCLVETFVKDFKCSLFPSHTAFAKPSSDLGRQGRESGGVVCLIRSTYLQYVRKVEDGDSGGGNFLSFILDKYLFGFSTDVLFVCAYVPPENSRFYSVFGIDNGINLLEDYLVDCVCKVGELPVLLCGDLNGRTANVFPDCFDESLIFDCSEKSDFGLFLRRSQDMPSYGVESVWEVSFEYVQFTWIMYHERCM
jgi:hypothetical protein